MESVWHSLRCAYCSGNYTNGENFAMHGNTSVNHYVNEVFITNLSTRGNIGAYCLGWCFVWFTLVQIITDLWWDEWWFLLPEVLVLHSWRMDIQCPDFLLTELSLNRNSVFFSMTITYSEWQYHDVVRLKSIIYYQIVISHEYLI